MWSLRQAKRKGSGLFSVLDKVYDWIDERIDLKTLQAKLLNEPMAGGARFAYVFGSILLFIFALQVVTGILLMFYYAPTADHAWESTKYIMEEVEYGWFILSYHLWGSSAMVMIVAMHMSQVYLWGAYKKPREMVWLVGLVLLGIVLGWLISVAVGAIAATADAELNPAIGIDSVLMATLFSAAVGLFFGLYPANRAANLEPVEALRYE